jgi:hypothetical protein
MARACSQYLRESASLGSVPYGRVATARKVLLARSVPIILCAPVCLLEKVFAYHEYGTQYSSADTFIRARTRVARRARGGSIASIITVYYYSVEYVRMCVFEYCNGGCVD